MSRGPWNTSPGYSFLLPVLQTSHNSPERSCALLLVEKLAAKVEYWQRARDLNSLADLEDGKIPTRDFVSRYSLR
jgi:hypothetical protein